MTPEVTLGLIAVVPVVVLMLLRINAALVFLSLCLGSVLVQFVGRDADSLIGTYAGNIPGNVSIGGNTVKIVLLLLPAVLTAIFMIRTVSGNSKLALNLLPALGVGLLGALLIVPLLPPGLSHNIVHSSLWTQTIKLQNLIVAASAFVCMLVLWLQRPKTGHSKHGKH